MVHTSSTRIHRDQSSLEIEIAKCRQCCNFRLVGIHPTKGISPEIYRLYKYICPRDNERQSRIYLPLSESPVLLVVFHRIKV